MRDFLNRELKSNDAIAFLRNGKLQKGYVVGVLQNKHWVTFWNDTQWDYVEVSKNRIVKLDKI